jgi:hypothetical protein
VLIHGDDIGAIGLRVSVQSLNLQNFDREFQQIHMRSLLPLQTHLNNHIIFGIDFEYG